MNKKDSTMHEKIESTDEAREENRHEKNKQFWKHNRIGLMLKVAPIILVLGAGLAVGPQLIGQGEQKAQVETLSTLEKIIDIEDLSIYQAVYNGIAQVYNEKNPEIIDYYVSYNAKVSAGFNPSGYTIDIDEASKVIKLTLPEIILADPIVDISSLDYIFQNKKLNKSAVSSEAYKACIEDATMESNQNTALFELAEENAKKVISALVSPVLSSLESKYSLEVVVGGEK